MRQKNLLSRRVPALPILVAGIAAFIPLLHANPKVGQVTNGAITISGGAGVTTISQTSQRGIIHWQDFSIGAGELTKFVQPNAGAATLNRVTGGIPSTIHGTLQANGQVYLVNPNGVLVGPNGRINTAAFTASTLDVPDASFMSGGDMRFSGSSPAGVVNLGSITANDGNVMLLGRSVQNDGSISAPNGVAGLAAGGDILLKAAGDEHVVIKSGTGGGTGVKNSGSIRAAQAELKAAGGNVYALAIKNTGVVQATGITKRNGRIFLGTDGGSVENSGRLIARNADGSGGTVKMKGGKGGAAINKGVVDVSASHPKKNGGTVEITGDAITIGSGSVITASGLNAGTIAIGVSADVANQTTASGGIATLALGANSDAAQQVTIEAGSRIEANSTGAGSGGRVVVWSERQSVVGGVIEAKGGDLGGNGGLIETSGRSGLTIIPGTKVDTAAPKGSAGTWLLDPAGITVDNNPTNTAPIPPPIPQSYLQAASTNHVNVSDIVTALSSGNVTIATTNAFAPNTDIVIASAIAIPTALGGSHTLSLNSAGGITLNASVGGAASDVIFQLQSHGDITVAPGATVQMNGISAFAITGNISFADQVTALNNKSIFLNAPTGSISFSGSGKANASSTGTVYLDTHSNNTGTITSSGPGAAVSAGNLDIWSGPQGVGTSASPFLTAVDNLVATVNTNTATSGGGVFISNSSGGTLHIGGTNTLSGQPAAGILVPSVTGWLGVELKNTAASIRIDSATGERITAQGDIKLTTTGASSDIQILNPGANSVRSHSGGVTLNAGGKVQIGDPATNVWGINVRGQTFVKVTAGGDVTVAGSLLKAGGGAGLEVTSLNGDVNILTSNGFAAIMGTSGGAPITLTTGAGKTFNNNTLSNGGVRTLLPDDVTSAVTPAGAGIFIFADKVVINSPIHAGTSNVGFALATSTRPVEIAAVKNVAKLSFSAAELNQITATDLTIGNYFGTGGFVVSDNIFAPATYKNLNLISEGNFNVGGSIYMPLGSLSVLSRVNNITITGFLGASDLSLNAGGNIDGSIGRVGALTLEFNANGNVVLTNPLNAITAINTGPFDVSSGVQINLKNSTALAINGTLGTLASPVNLFPTTYVNLQVGGDLTINAGASIKANNIDLNLIGGILDNQSGLAGNGALQVIGRYRVWESSLAAAAPHKGNLTATDFPTAVPNPSDPGSGNVFYYATVPATPPPPPPAPRVIPAQVVADKVIATFGKDGANEFFRGLGYAGTQDYLDKNGAGVRKVLGYEPPPLSAEGEAFRKLTGFDPLPDASITLQRTLWGLATVRPGDEVTAQDIQMMLRGGAQSLTVAQINDLSPANVWYLAMRGQHALGLPDNDRIFGYVTRDGAGGGQLTAEQTARFINDGPTGVKNISGGRFSLDNGMFITAVLPSELQQSPALARVSGQAIIIPKGMPLDGSVLLLPGILGPGGIPLINQDGSGLVSHDGVSLVSHDGVSLISHDGHDGNSLVSHDGVSLINQDGSGLIGHDGNSLIGHDGNSLIGHDGNSLIGHDGNSVR